VNRSALVISLIAIFLVGAALGLMGGIVFSHQVRSALRDSPGPFSRLVPPPHPRSPLRDALPRLQRLLDLTPEQVKRIEPRVLESQQQFEAARESLHSRIDAELTPAQRERWKAFERTHPFPGPPRGDDDRTHRAPPGDEGEHR
jgi:hypothetical protein